MTERPDAVLYKRLQRESAQLLGLDPDAITAVQMVRVDLVASLRLALDTFTAAQLAGERVDTSKLLSCAESLERLLPRSASPLNAKAHLDSVRAKFTALIDSYANEYDRAQDVEIAALKAEVAELKETLAGKDAAIAALGGATVAAKTASPPRSPPPAPPQQQTSPQPPLQLSSAPYVRREPSGSPWGPIPGSSGSPRNW